MLYAELLRGLRHDLLALSYGLAADCGVRLSCSMASSFGASPHRRGAQRHGRGSGGVPGRSGAPDAGFRQPWPLAGDARVHGRARAPATCAPSGGPGWSPHPYWPRPLTSSALGPGSHPRHRTRLTSHAVSSRPPLLYAAQASKARASSAGRCMRAQGTFWARWISQDYVGRSWSASGNQFWRAREFSMRFRGDSRGAEARRGAWFCRNRMERAADELGFVSLAIAPMRLSIPQAFEPADQP